MVQQSKLKKPLNAGTLRKDAPQCESCHSTDWMNGVLYHAPNCKLYTLQKRTEPRKA